MRPKNALSRLNKAAGECRETAPITGQTVVVLDETTEGLSQPQWIKFVEKRCGIEISLIPNRLVLIGSSFKGDPST